MLILVTGATGKVGHSLIARLTDDPRFRRLASARSATTVCSTKPTGSRWCAALAAQALSGVSHVAHLATGKETPDDVMDVTVKGLFRLLEEFRTSQSGRQSILIGGDAGVGHFYYRHDTPITEETPHMAYPGSYALSKVLEEVFQAGSTPTGWTTARPSTFWTGNPTTIWKGSSTRPGNTSVRETLASSGIPG